MLHGAAAHHGFEVGAYIWTEGAHPKPLLSLLSEAGTWAACWGEPWPNAHSTEARSHLGSDIWERHGTSWTENVMRDPSPCRSQDGTTAVEGPATWNCQQVTSSALRHRPPSTGMDQAHVKAREQHGLCPGCSGQAAWWFSYRSRAAISYCLLLQGLDQPHGSSLCRTTLPTAHHSFLSHSSLRKPICQILG